MRTSLLLAFLAIAAMKASAQGVDLTTNESPPVVVGGLKFVAVTYEHWIVQPGNTHAIRIDLRITNVTKHRLFFPTFDTVMPGICAADGKPVDMIGVRYNTTHTQPLDLAPGASSIVPLEGHLTATSPKTGYLKAFDGTGTGYHCPNLAPGSYMLSFYVQSTAENAARAKKVALFLKHLTPPDSLLWFGKAETKGAPFQISTLP